MPIFSLFSLYSNSGKVYACRIVDTVRKATKDKKPVQSLVMVEVIKLIFLREKLDDKIVITYFFIFVRVGELLLVSWMVPL